MDNCKYLGCWVNELIGKNAKTVEALTSAASTSYGRIVGMFHKLGDNSFINLNKSHILPVANCGASKITQHPGSFKIKSVDFI